MSTQRTVIPAGSHDFAQPVLEPIVRFLIARGHPPLGFEEKLGWRPTPSGMVCALQGPITPEDWAAINEHFELPPTIAYEVGCIRDHANWADIEGARYVT